MKKLKILYVGSDSGTSGHRLSAMRRLGHEVELADLRFFFPRNPIIQRVFSKFTFEFGAGLFEAYMAKRLVEQTKSKNFDLAWINGGELVGSGILTELGKMAAHVVNYHNDDPFGGRDKRLWTLFLKSVPLYDAIIVMREVNVSEAYAAGARNVIRSWMSADEVAHAPVILDRDDELIWSSEVSFIGTWMPERGPFMARLIELGIPVSIYGDRWQKAKEWPALAGAWRGPSINGVDYVKAIAASKVCLALLSKGNRDLHTTRTTEIPYAGGVLCAERTSEHSAMYEEGREAMFWSSPEECAEKCRMLLADNEFRKKMKIAGRDRCLKNGYLNEVMLAKVLSEVRC